MSDEGNSFTAIFAADVTRVSRVNSRSFFCNLEDKERVMSYIECLKDDNKRIAMAPYNHMPLFLRKNQNQDS